MTNGATLDSTVVEALEQADNKTLATWWCVLNRHQWPDALPKNDERRWDIMSWIMQHIGIKECLREWNKDDLPGEHFDNWYNRGAALRP